MSVTFALRFTGLCAFASKPNQAMRVVLPNARDNHAGMHHKRHLAAVVVEQRYLGANGRNPDGTILGITQPDFSPTGDDLKVFLLDGEDLAIQPSAGPLVLEPGPGSGSQCPLPTDAGGFGWIARMGDIDPAAAPMQGRAFSGQNRAVVLGRLVLTSGTLSTWAFAASPPPDSQILKWQYKKPDGSDARGPVRALAELMNLYMEYPQSPSLVAIVSSPFSGLQVDPINLVPDASGRIEAWMVNIPEDILWNGGAMLLEPDHHFAHFHAISVGNLTHIPHPEPKTQGCGPFPGGTLSSPKCPPAYFEG